MKHSVLFFLSAILLLSCGNKKQDSIVASTKQEAADSSSVNTYMPDWMKKYQAYLKENFESCGNKRWQRKGEDYFFDCEYWCLAYINNDTIPEMLLYGGCSASGTELLTQYDGKVYELPEGGSEYIKGDVPLILRYISKFCDISGVIYEMRKGKFIEKCNFRFFSDHLDIKEVKKMGLDGNTVWKSGDDDIRVKGIEWNGKLLKAEYGERCWDIDDKEVRKLLHSVYFSKGESISIFPEDAYYPDKKFTVDSLMNRML